MPRLVSIALALTTVPVAAQVAHIDVKRNNAPYYVYEFAQHPQTGLFYNHPVFQPPGYEANSVGEAGVLPGTTTWRWIPSEVDDRRETRNVSGFYVWMRPSAATDAPYPFTGYIPQWTLYASQPRADGGHAPDPTQPLHVVPQASFPFLTPDAYRATTSLSASLPLDEREVCFGLQWVGGEHRLRHGAQGFVGTSDEVAWDVPTGGYMPFGGAPVVVDGEATYAFYSTLWASYLSADPVLNVGNDFAFDRRFPPPGPLPFSGHNDAAGLNDLSTTSVSFTYECDAGPAFGGNDAYLLFNLVGAIPQAPFLFEGLTFELNLGNPLLGTMVALGVVGRLDASGRMPPAEVTLSPIGTGLLGFHLGAEFLIMDPGFTQFLGTTGAHWSRVVP